MVGARDPVRAVLAEDRSEGVRFAGSWVTCGMPPAVEPADALGNTARIDVRDLAAEARGHVLRAAIDHIVASERLVRRSAVALKEQDRCRRQRTTTGRRWRWSSLSDLSVVIGFTS